MVYSHFLFLLKRILVFIFVLLKLIPNALHLKILSLIVSLDTLFAIIIYFGPKFLRVLNPLPNTARGVHMKSTGRRSVLRDSNGSVSSRFRNIPGVKIPDEGIPNLIVRRKSAASHNSSITSHQGLQGLRRESMNISNAKSVSFSTTIQGPVSNSNNSAGGSNGSNRNNTSEQCVHLDTYAKTNSTTSLLLPDSFKYDDENFIESFNDDITLLLASNEIDESLASKLRRVREKASKLDKLFQQLNGKDSKEGLDGAKQPLINKEGIIEQGVNQCDSSSNSSPDEDGLKLASNFDIASTRNNTEG